MSELADNHWEYSEKLLLAWEEYQDGRIKLLDFVGIVYKEAFDHGLKHGEEFKADESDRDAENYWKSIFTIPSDGCCGTECDTATTIGNTTTHDTNPPFNYNQTMTFGKAMDIAKEMGKCSGQD